ncbi:hypothetical protein PUN28_009397 [Cardiocondyla obscurior]|uniref:HTH psq-type domain-containing protein n=1 Tax=Cardiocondyla obscurior TaxID=286306 RepID=A0AAW2FWW7_9HYME
MPRNESRSAGKRPMRATTPQEKMDAIGRVHTGESKAAVARDIGVPESTLRGWCKAEEKIRTQLNNVRATGTYEHILTSSSENSDNSLPGSSSRSTPTQNTMPSTSGGAEKVGDEPEAGPAPKRIKQENNYVLPSASAISATGSMNATGSINASALINSMNNINNVSNMNNLNSMSTSSRGASDLLISPFLYSQLLANDPKHSSTVAALFHSILSSSTFLHSSANLLGDNMHRSNGTLPMSMANMLPANNMLINGKRKYGSSGFTSTADVSSRVSTRRQNTLSLNTAKPSGSTSPSSMFASTNASKPSTSVNSNAEVGASAATSLSAAKSPKENTCKKLDAIICQLQQQQNAGPAERECSPAEMMSNNAMNNNNNNVDHVDNETTNRKSPNSLPPGFADMLMYCSKLVEWLQTYGSPICTFQQVTQIRIILDNMMNWANSKEIKPEKKANGSS